MAVVKTVRRAGQRLGATLDAEDRELLGVVTVWASAIAVAVLGGAALLATAFRIFGAIAS